MGKPVNFTTREWCTMFAYMLAFSFVSQQCFRDVINGDYLHTAAELVGTIGWVILYLKFMNHHTKKKEESK